MSSCKTSSSRILACATTTDLGQIYGNTHPPSGAADEQANRQRYTAPRHRPSTKKTPASMNNRQTAASEAAKKDREINKFFDFGRVRGAEPEPEFEEEVCQPTYVVVTSKKLTHSRISALSTATMHSDTNPAMTKTWSPFGSILRLASPFTTSQRPCVGCLASRRRSQGYSVQILLCIDELLLPRRYCCCSSAFGSKSIYRDAPLWWPLTSSQPSLFLPASLATFTPK